LSERRAEPASSAERAARSRARVQALPRRRPGAAGRPAAPWPDV